MTLDPTFTPIAPNAARRGPRVRLFADVRWTLLADGAYAAIDDQVRRVYDPRTAAWRLDYIPTGGGEPAWIQMRALARPRGQLRRIVDEPHRWGHVLAGDQLPAAAEYEILHSDEGVQRVPNGWRFTAIPETVVGMLFDDWRSRFGPKRVRLTADRAALDLSDYPVEPDAHGVWPEIDLDPQQQAGGVCKYLSSAGGGSAAAAWAWARALANGTATADQAIASGQTLMVFPGFWNGSCGRIGLRFDTVAYGDATAAVLVCNRLVETGSDLYGAAKATFATPLTTTSNYGAVKAAYDANHIGTLDQSGDPTWTIDVFSQWAASATFDLALYGEDDRTNTVPGDPGYSASFTPTGDDMPYLEITVPSGGAPPAVLAAHNARGAI